MSLIVTRRNLARLPSGFGIDLFSRTVSLMTSSVTVIGAASCAILYVSFWAVALLQNQGLIHTNLPIPVADGAIIKRSHLELQLQSVAAADKDQRAHLLAEAQTAPSLNATVAISPLTLDIQATAPADLWVLDSQGNGTGVEPLSGLALLQISDTSYSGRATNPQLVSIPHAIGSYRLRLVGSATGSYVLTVRLMANGDTDNAVQYVGAGQVFEDTILQATITVNLEGNQPQLSVSDVDVLMTETVPDSSMDALPVTNGGIEPAAVMRLKPPAKLPLPIPLPGVIQPLDTPSWSSTEPVMLASITSDAAVPTSATPADIGNVDSMALSSGDAPAMASANNGSPPGGSSAALSPANSGPNEPAPSSTIVAPSSGDPQPTIFPVAAATDPPSSSISSAPSDPTSSSSPPASTAPTQSGNPQSTATPTLTPTPTTMATLSPSASSTAGSSSTPTPSSSGSGSPSPASTSSPISASTPTGSPSSPSRPSSGSGTTAGNASSGVGSSSAGPPSTSHSTTQSSPQQPDHGHSHLSTSQHDH